VFYQFTCLVRKSVGSEVSFVDSSFYQFIYNQDKAYYQHANRYLYFN